MKVAIVGSREWPDPDRVRDFVASLPDDTIIVSGGARGVDTVAVNAAKARGLPVKVFPAQWKKYGNRAGPLRNSLIVEEADRVVAFWCRRSRGTHDTIRKTRAAEKPLAIFRVQGEETNPLTSELTPVLPSPRR